jgi:hypothetical protein
MESPPTGIVARENRNTGTKKFGEPIMTRRDLISLLVLAEISDDYEEPRHIFKRVARRAKICGTRAKLEDVHSSLANLIESGLAKAYRLSPREDVAEFTGIPPDETFGDHYYYITKDGQDTLAKKSSLWPFDADGLLLPGWATPID